MDTHKEAKTHILSSSQLATHPKRFPQACAQTLAISNILHFDDNREVDDNVSAHASVSKMYHELKDRF